MFKDIAETAIEEIDKVVEYQVISNLKRPLDNHKVMYEGIVRESATQQRDANLRGGAAQLSAASMAPTMFGAFESVTDDWNTEKGISLKKGDYYDEETGQALVKEGDNYRLYDTEGNPSIGTLTPKEANNRICRLLQPQTQDAWAS